MKLRGGCIHHDNGVLGACGKYGMYVIDEAFDGWYILKTYHDYARVFKHHYAADLKAMAQKDKNRPCVISYSIGNEVTETAEEKGIELVEKMVQILHEADSTRLVTCGINPMLNWLVKRGMGLYRENSVYLPEQLPPKEEKQKEQKAGSAFFNMLMQKASAMTQWIAKSDGAGKAIRSSAEKLDDIRRNYRLPKVGRTVGEMLAEARQKSGVEQLKGHDIMALERFVPETRHMVVFEVLSGDSFVVDKGDRMRLFLTDDGYRKFQERQENGEIKI